MRVAFKVFRSETKLWEVLFQEAADFLTEIGPERAICVSHSQHSFVGMVVAWYRTDEPPPKPSKH